MTHTSVFPFWIREKVCKRKTWRKYSSVSIKASRKLAVAESDFIRQDAGGIDHDGASQSIVPDKYKEIEESASGYQSL